MDKAENVINSDNIVDVSNSSGITNELPVSKMEKSPYQVVKYVTLLRTANKANSSQTLALQDELTSKSVKCESTKVIKIKPKKRISEIIGTSKSTLKTRKNDKRVLNNLDSSTHKTEESTTKMRYRVQATKDSHINIKPPFLLPTSNEEKSKRTRELGVEFAQKNGVSNEDTLSIMDKYEWLRTLKEIVKSSLVKKSAVPPIMKKAPVHLQTVKKSPTINRRVVNKNEEIIGKPCVLVSVKANKDCRLSTRGLCESSHVQKVNVQSSLEKGKRGLTADKLKHKSNVEAFNLIRDQTVHNTTQKKSNLKPELVSATEKRIESVKSQRLTKKCVQKLIYSTYDIFSKDEHSPEEHCEQKFDPELRVAVPFNDTPKKLLKGNDEKVVDMSSVKSKSMYSSRHKKSLVDKKKRSSLSSNTIDKCEKDFVKTTISLRTDKDNEKNNHKTSNRSSISRKNTKKCDPNIVNKTSQVSFHHNEDSETSSILQGEEHLLNIEDCQKKIPDKKLGLIKCTRKNFPSVCVKNVRQKYKHFDKESDTFLKTTKMSPNCLAGNKNVCYKPKSNSKDLPDLIGKSHTIEVLQEIKLDTPTKLKLGRPKGSKGKKNQTTFLEYPIFVCPLCEHTEYYMVLLERHKYLHHPELEGTVFQEKDCISFDPKFIQRKRYAKKSTDFLTDQSKSEYGDAACTTFQERPFSDNSKDDKVTGTTHNELTNTHTNYSTDSSKVPADEFVLPETYLRTNYLIPICSSCKVEDDGTACNDALADTCCSQDSPSKNTFTQFKDIELANNVMPLFPNELPYDYI